MSKNQGEPPEEGRTPTPQSDNVIELPWVDKITTFDQAPQCLRVAAARNLEKILVLGLFEDSDLFIHSTNGLTTKDALYMVEKAKKHIMGGE